MEIEKQETRQARQRASVKWLLSKAFNNRVPDNLKEPFYRDHENQERLKPQITVELGNATLYCQTLSNLYSDPNYQSVNHWSILQTLARKGVPVKEIPDMPITETVLIQTNPLRINAHMSVIDSLMILFAKEISSGDRIPNVTSSNLPTTSIQNCEQYLLGWISHTCASLKKRITQEAESGAVDENGIHHQIPDIPLIRELQDLCDGVCLVLLISYYCPKIVPWRSARINYLPAVSDSIYNVLLVSNFSQKHLPYSVFHMVPEDITYMRRSMKPNLIAFLADLFNLFEIHPAKCVCYPELDSQVTRLASENVISRRSAPPKGPSSNENHDSEENTDEDFTVHKTRPITTLSSMQNQEPLLPARLRQAKEKSNVESKADERGDNVPAGRPSNWEENRRPSYAGRRSRRNSSSEDSQLTIENFGGSQDQLNMIGFDRDRGREKERDRSFSNINIEPAVAVRSSLADARGSLQLGYDTDSGSEKQDRETEKNLMKCQESIVDNKRFCNVQHSNGKDREDGDPTVNSGLKSSSSYDNSSLKEEPKRKTSFAALPMNTTTWQQQSALLHQCGDGDDIYPENDPRSSVDATKLSSIRIKLEEKRRRIEEEKRKIEVALSKHHEKFGKAAFLQAIKGNTQQQLENDFESHAEDIQADNNIINNSEQQPDTAIPISQEPFGSQQHIPGQYHRQIVQAFGSTPHLSQVYNSNQSFLHEQHRKPEHIQYINENGQYLSQYPNFMTTHNISQLHPQQPNSLFLNMSREDFCQKMHANIRDPHSQYPLEQLKAQTHHQYAKRLHEYDDYPPSHYERDNNLLQSNHFYLHELSPQTMHRKTWAQSSTTHPETQNSHSQPETLQLIDVNAWQSRSLGSKVPEPLSSKPSPNNQNSGGSGFILHRNAHHNEEKDNCNQEHTYKNQFQGYLSALHEQTPSKTEMDNQKLNSSPNPPPLDDMAPQSICFIGDEEEDNIIDHPEMNNKTTHMGYKITSGSLTYRIPSPSRPALNANSFQKPHDDSSIEKGFYISFGDDQPKRPKPPLRTKRSPKKEKDSEIRETLQVQHRHNKSETERDNNFENNDATYNKYAYTSLQLRHLVESKSNNIAEHRQHLEDVSKQQQQFISLSHQHPPFQKTMSLLRLSESKENKSLLIGTQLSNMNPESVEEMERKKEKIMLLSLQRRQYQEEEKARKEIEALNRREKERKKEEERARKKEEQMARRATILEQHRLKKASEEAEREGKAVDRSEFLTQKHNQQQNSAPPRIRPQKVTRPRPKTIHVESSSTDLGEGSSLLSCRSKKGSISSLTDYSQCTKLKREFYRGSQDSLAMKESPDEYPSTSSTPIDCRGSYKNSREPTVERGRTMSRISVAKGSTLNFRGRKSNSLMNLCDSDLGRSTPPRRAPSPGISSSNRHMPSPSGPGSLPPGLVSKRRVIDDGSSDISSSNPNSIIDYSGPKLYKQPAAKSNRGIILNAVEYCVFPGAVNRDAKQKVLEKIARSDVKHFLVLFRDAGCQFRALYSYVPEIEQVLKIYGTGPSQVDEVMFDKFFKYNSGGKCFSPVHTKHLTVTIDAFTIHNSLWQGKKVQLPSKRDMALVI